MTETNGLAAINNFPALYKHYKEIEGFAIERVLTTEQRKQKDAKAHVVFEYLRFDFKYVPLNGKHYYLFKTEEDAKQFDGYVR